MRIVLRGIMRVTTAEFLTAAADGVGYPKGGLAEIAFAGRSNVGKSSLINTLLGRRNLVRTSRTPGHTRKLNFFLVNNSFIFVDFPGYGYAAVPLEVKAKWGAMTERYLRERAELRGVVALVDIRLSLTDTDERMIGLLKTLGIPHVVAATKADKITRSKRSVQIREIRSKIGEEVPLIIFSSHDGLGKNELWKEIKSLIE